MDMLKMALGYLAMMGLFAIGYSHVLALIMR